MAEFKIGDEVNYVLGNTGCTGTLTAVHPDGKATVEHGQAKSVIEYAKLLPPKTASFRIRGLVMTTSATHSGEVGEIIATGKSASGKTFYEVRYQSDPRSEWFSEDNVLINDAEIPKRSPRVRVL
jgi:hypothetical protein